jgi:hypothetical protein
MDFPEVRKFLHASYHDLPNILFVGSLILGSLLGYLPLVWVALGLIFNGVITYVGQLFIQMILSNFESKISTSVKNQLRQSGLERCNIGFQFTGQDKLNFKSLSAATDVIVAPSYWISSTAFFAMFSIYNSIQVYSRDPKGRVDPLLKSTRKAFSLSTLIIGLVFMVLIALRVFTGCETITGTVLGMGMGIGIAIGFWHILDGCGTGKIPDILQVVGSMAPDQSTVETPVMCTAEED